MTTYFELKLEQMNISSRLDIRSNSDFAYPFDFFFALQILQQFIVDGLSLVWVCNFQFTPNENYMVSKIWVGMYFALMPKRNRLIFISLYIRHFAFLS